uniref:ATP synthase F0 subunit 8 n=1 Tax=Pseudorimula sp. RSIO35641 TaxID=2652779 RepID=A0A5J6VA27_9VEST|nr:ATP synthase F0 subunit 8 [Pseudorimula sp. RSIO35641]
MPQLSPINWLFFYYTFWVVIFSCLCLLWWVYCLKFEFMGKKVGVKGLESVESKFILLVMSEGVKEGKSSGSLKGEL